MGPLLPLVALGALGIGSQYLAGDAQAKHQKRLEKEQRLANRRAAIERAMGGTSLSRPPELPQAPDTSNYALISGLANLGSNLYAQKYLR